MTTENKTHCPLDTGDIDIASKPVSVHGKRKVPDTSVICVIKMFQRQVGIKAGFAKCGSCNVDIQVGEFDDASSKSLTIKN